jgi:plastocyanin
MRRLMFLLALTACGSDDGTQKPPDGSKPIDAKPIDAAPDAQAFVLKVDCGTVTPAATVTTNGGAYMPVMTNIALNDVVKFVMIPGSNHNVVPAAGMPSDPGLNAGFGVDTCLRFTKAGEFNFECGPHGFRGKVTVP